MRLAIIPLLALFSVACTSPGEDGTRDNDLDGFTPDDGDCDDELAAVNPAQTDLVGDAIDQNCDGVDGTDVDGDGVASSVSGGDDCDDEDADRWPGSDEVLGDGVDQDCNGADGFADSFLYEGTSEADLLFVVDNSCSMSEEQGRLVAALPGLFDALAGLEIDFHMGVVSTDMEDFTQRGKLQSDPWSGVKYLELDEPDHLAVAQRMFDLGNWGSADEKGRVATYAAIETHGLTHNAGFARDTAHLATIVLTDENDYSGDSPIALANFIDWYGQLRPEAGASFHGIIGPETVCDDAWEHGAEYQAVIDAIGGETGSICDADYLPTLLDITSYLSDATPITLTADPIPDSIRVFVTPLDGTREERTEGWTYTAEDRRIRFDERPPLESTIEVNYDVVIAE